MTRNLSYLIFLFFYFFDKIFTFLFKRSLLIFFSEFIEKKSIKKKNILNREVKFFSTNHLIDSRIRTLFIKEPETIDWINNFKKKRFIFWDIGANIGLYSVYNAIKNKHSISIAFEPSTANLRILSRNISMNNLENRIKIFSLPLTDKPPKFMCLRESFTLEGASMNTFGERFDFQGKKLMSKINYPLYGMNINYLLSNKLLKLPDYIKIDVDGIEHLILKGGDKFLKSKKIRSVLVEINENFQKQFNSVLKFMKKNNFKIRHKKNNYKLYKKYGDQFINTYNYIFDKKY